MDWISKSNDEILNELGQRFKVIRMSKKLTQQILADETGLNRSTIQDLENGKAVNISSLISVMRRLNLLDMFDKAFPDFNSSPVLAITKNSKKRVRPAKDATIY